MSATNISERTRKVDMTKLTKEEADLLGEQIGAKVREKVDKTIDEINAFLKIYGMSAKMQVALEPIEKEVKGQ